jgi:hypothetical protein
MAKKPSASLIAHKVISLSGDMTASEKCVLAALIDHFNFVTGQCDPALNSIAKLLRKSRRTIIRAMNSLILKGYLRKTKHGGYFHRNKYEPNWSRFQLEEERWAAHRKHSRYKKPVADLAPYEGQSCHVAGDSGDTLTTPLITYPETSTAQRVPESRSVGGEDEKGHSIKADCNNSEYYEMPESAEIAQRVLRSSPGSERDGPLNKAILAGAMQLLRRVKRGLYTAWFLHLEFEEKIDGCLVFSVPTKLKRSTIEQQYPTLLKECFCPKVPGTSEIQIFVRT